MKTHSVSYAEHRFSLSRIGPGGGVGWKEHEFSVLQSRAGGNDDDGESAARSGGDYPVADAADRGGEQRGNADRAVGAANRPAVPTQNVSLDGDRGNAGV